jgi:cytochrome c oxidase subunit 3
MVHVEEEPKVHMGIPMPHSKLAMWLFLVTEIMFFTGIIGVYLLVRNGAPSDYIPWPAPSDVHLIEVIGAINTFVLIVSSFTVVWSHYELHHGRVKRSIQLIGATLALGCVFLAIKAFEYKSKFDHQILPGRIYEKLDSPWGIKYIQKVNEDLSHVTAPVDSIEELEKVLASGKTGVELTGEVRGVVEKYEQFAHAAMAPVKQLVGSDPKKEVTKAEVEALIKEAPREKNEEYKDCKELQEKLPILTPKMVNAWVVGLNEEPHKPRVRPVDLPTKEQQEQLPKKGLLQKYPHLHLTHSIPWGNMWASCYFAMTGFHALHVLGGLVIFVVMIVMYWRGKFGPQHERLLENTGLYWHFVDIVWIFLFPLLYLV